MDICSILALCLLHKDKDLYVNDIQCNVLVYSYAFETNVSLVLVNLSLLTYNIINGRK